MNLLHDIPPGTSEKMNVIIEIPKFSKNKYKKQLITLWRMRNVLIWIAIISTSTSQPISISYNIIIAGNRS